MATDLDLRGRAVVSVAKYDYTLWLKLMGGYGITIESPLTIDDVVLSPQPTPPRYAPATCCIAMCP